GKSGRFWLSLTAYFALTVLGILLFNPMSRFFESLDAMILRRFVELRSPVVNDVSLAINGLASLWSIRVIRWSVIAVLLVSRRWRHLLVYVGAVLALEIAVQQTSLSLGRARPFDVTILGPWTGFSMPSRPLAALAISLMGVLYTVLPRGRARDVGKWIVGVVLAAVIVARLILAIEAPTSAIFGAVLGIAVGLG